MSRERALLAGTRVAFNNPAIQRRDIVAYERRGLNLPGEVVAWICDPGVFAGIPAELDRRDRAARRRKSPEDE